MSRILSWANPTQNEDGTAFDAADIGGYEVQFDGAGAVVILATPGPTTAFDLNTLDAYTALARGKHSIALDVVTKEGLKSAFSAATTFLVGSAPMAPTALKVA